MLAIDLGGTRVKATVLRDGVPGDVLVAEHGSSDLAGALACVESLIAQLDVAPGSAAGMCVPGLVEETGRVVALPGKLTGAVGADLVGWLEQRTGGPALVANDAIAYGVGEAADLPGRTVVMTIGTGIGTAVIEDGRPLGLGPLGGGLLGGQLPLTGDGPRDTSERAGTVEAWCRAVRLRDEVRAAGHDAADVPGAYDAAVAGDPAALCGLASYRGWLARGIAALCLAHAPDAVVVGGGPVRPDGLLLQGLQALVDPLLWSGQRVEVRASRHGDAAALVGLSALVARSA